MPATTGLLASQIRLVNTAFAMTFFKRVMKNVWPRICGTTESHSSHENFAFNGASPNMKLFFGSMQSQTIQSYSLDVPNLLFKNIEIIKRNQIEFDQTDTLLKSRVGLFGLTVAQLPDYQLAYQMIQGSTAGSQTVVNPEDGKSYTVTFDNQPVYSTAHNTGGIVTNYNNIIQGGLPTTVAALNAQDLSTSAQQMWNDVAKIVANIATYSDDKGNMLLPDFDSSEQLVLYIPPCLKPAAELAFKTQGAIAGSGGSAGGSGSTTNVGWRMVKDVVVFPLLQGCTNVYSNIPGATVSPANATQYYYGIVNDYTRPFYNQIFTPLAGSNTIPQGYDPLAEMERVLANAEKASLPVTPESAAVYAATEISTNLGAIGNQGQIDVATLEQFFIAGRTRQTIFPGPWPQNGKIDPVGNST